VTPSPTPCGLSDTGLVLLVRCPPLTAWPRGHPRSAIQVYFLLACLLLCCLWCWCVVWYYEKIKISVAIATESEHDLVRGLGRSVEGVASGRGFVAGDRACPTAPSPPLGGAGEDRQQGAPHSKTFRSGLCAGYRRRFRRRLAASPTLPAGFLQRILSGAPSCASVSPQHQQQCISKSVVDCCVASTVAC
jgi:hypothetical protein